MYALYIFGELPVGDKLQTELMWTKLDSSFWGGGVLTRGEPALLTGQSVPSYHYSATRPAVLRYRTYQHQAKSSYTTMVIINEQYCRSHDGFDVHTAECDQLVVRTNLSTQGPSGPCFPMHSSDCRMPVHIPTPIYATFCTDRPKWLWQGWRQD